MEGMASMADPKVEKDETWKTALELEPISQRADWATTTGQLGLSEDVIPVVSESSADPTSPTSMF